MHHSPFSALFSSFQLFSALLKRAQHFSIEQIKCAEKCMAFFQPPHVAYIEKCWTLFRSSERSWKEMRSSFVKKSWDLLLKRAELYSCHFLKENFSAPFKRALKRAGMWSASFEALFYHFIMLLLLNAEHFFKVHSSFVDSFNYPKQLYLK